jgi:hypothetical protein
VCFLLAYTRTGRQASIWLVIGTGALAIAGVAREVAPLEHLKHVGGVKRKRYSSPSGAFPNVRDEETEPALEDRTLISVQHGSESKKS